MREELWRPVDGDDERVRRGAARLADTLEQWVNTGDELVGWKVGWNDLQARAALGVSSGVVGVLASSRVSSAGTMNIAALEAPAWEVELCLRVEAHPGNGVSVIGAAPAIEVLDLVGFDVETALAANVWHHAGVLGREHPFDDHLHWRARVTARHNEREVAVERPCEKLGSLTQLLRFVDSGARLLGRGLASGDIVLTGNLSPGPQPIQAGDQVRIDFDHLGALEVSFA